MSEIRWWEKKFVDRYIVPEKRRRYLDKLKGPKHRAQILDRLNHNLDYIPELASSIAMPDRNMVNLLQLLRQERVAETCHILADGNEFDGKELRLEYAVEELCNNAFGIVMICPPIPIAIYKEEDIGDMMLLKL